MRHDDSIRGHDSSRRARAAVCKLMARRATAIGAWREHVPGHRHGDCHAETPGIADATGLPPPPSGAASAIRPRIAVKGITLYTRLYVVQRSVERRRADKATLNDDYYYRRADEAPVIVASMLR